MKKFLFLFGLLALLLSAEAAPMKAVDYQSDVGLTDKVNSISQSISAGVINYEFTVAAYDCSTYTYSFAEVSLFPNAPEVYMEYVSTDHNSIAAVDLERANYDINAPPVVQEKTNLNKSATIKVNFQ